MLFAPGLFSTITGWPSASASLGATRRALTSTALPGPVGTIQRSGFAGQVCALTVPAHTSAAIKMAFIFIFELKNR